MPRRLSRLSPLALGLAVALLSGCVETFPNLDFRGNAISGASTETAPRPEPDANGLITYETYQVVVARRGDTVAEVAGRVGLTAAELASFNGRAASDVLREGEVLAMPRRVGPAGHRHRLDRARRHRRGRCRPARPAGPQVQPGVEPVRHRVGRGETAYSVARLYGVSVRSLAEWNGLGPDLAVRENQYLIIPIVLEGEAGAGTQAPGDSIAPPPPSAGEPLPDPIETAPLPPATGGGPTPPAPAPAPPRSPSPNPSRPRASSGRSTARSCAPSPRPTRGSTSRRRPARRCAPRAMARWPRSPRTPTRCRSW
jgi:lipoprotein NlpD